MLLFLSVDSFQIEHGACIFATTRSDNEIAADKCEYKLDDDEVEDVDEVDEANDEDGFDEEARCKKYQRRSLECFVEKRKIWLYIKTGQGGSMSNILTN